VTRDVTTFLRYSRGYVPHIDDPGLSQLVTFRQDDSVPARLLRMYSNTVEAAVGAETKHEKQTRVLAHMEKYLAKGRGTCRLRDPRAAAIVEGALRYHERSDYRLIAWVVMPNHVHIVLRRARHVSLATIVRRWKSWTARRINEMSGRTGRLWQREWVDRWLREEDALWSAIKYVELNPVAAGLCKHPLDWPFSSARRFPERWSHKLED
jgi:REP element-mobilizing transposase RayT